MESFSDKLKKIEPDVLGGAVSIQSVPRRQKVIQPNEALELITSRIGDVPRLNLRTRYVEIHGQAKTADDISRFYLKLDNANERWNKGLVEDVIHHIANENRFDPVSVYLHNLSKTSPLDDEKWENLDQFLFNIEDEITKKYMKRFLVAAVKRVEEPACIVRQLPVLIGPQNIGKTELGKALFSPAFYGSGVSGKFDVDDITKLERVWCLELGELDGITRKSQIEAFKAFISETKDISRRKYGKGMEDIPRRSIFWASSNAAPLNDPTGSTRFVCIPLPNKKLPFLRVANNRDSIWHRAYLEYKKGYQCYSTDQEMEEILYRNGDFEQVDPWYEDLRRYVEKYSTKQVLYTEDLFKEIGLVETYQINNAANVRLKNVMRQLGWGYKRRMLKGDQIRGYWRLPTSPP
tara:strand:+ start:122 stop:1339 length:1218 start_codon:yes stop_codon:yes gene_type:complete